MKAEADMKAAQSMVQTWKPNEDQLEAKLLKTDPTITIDESFWWQYAKKMACNLIMLRAATE